MSSCGAPSLSWSGLTYVRGMTSGLQMDDVSAGRRAYLVEMRVAGSVVRRWLSRLTPVDVAITLVVALIGQQEVWFPAANFSDLVGPRPVVCLVYLGSSLALLWRRVAPLTVLSVVVLVLSLDYLAYGAPDGLGTLLPPVVAFFAVGRHAQTPRFLIGLGFVVVHLVVHEYRDPHFTLDGPTVVLWAIVVGVGFLGVVLRARDGEVREAVRKAELLEAVGAEEERRIVEAERRRLAGELHDIVGHGLSLMVLQLVALDGTVDKGDPTAARQMLGSLEQTARETLAESRRLVQVMDGAVERLNPQPGLSDLPELVAKVSSAGVPIELRVRGEAAVVSAGLGLTVYRVVQEALTNVARHARPAAAQVAVEVTADRLTVEVHDVGEGSVAGEPGRGLRGMASRVDLYGGTFHAGRGDSGGYHVRAEFPLPEVRA